MRQVKFILLIVPLFLQSCIPVFLVQGERKKVVITSEPTNAKIYVDNKYVGSGYAVVKLRRGQAHFVVAEQEEYEAGYMTIECKPQIGWIAADILTDGFIEGSYTTFNNHYLIELYKK